MAAPEPEPAQLVSPLMEPMAAPEPDSAQAEELEQAVLETSEAPAAEALTVPEVQRLPRVADFEDEDDDFQDLSDEDFGSVEWHPIMTPLSRLTSTSESSITDIAVHFARRLTPGTVKIWGDGATTPEQGTEFYDLESNHSDEMSTKSYPSNPDLAAEQIFDNITSQFEALASPRSLQVGTPKFGPAEGPEQRDRDRAPSCGGCMECFSCLSPQRASRSRRDRRELRKDFGMSVCAAHGA